MNHSGPVTADQLLWISHCGPVTADQSLPTSQCGPVTADQSQRLIENDYYVTDSTKLIKAILLRDKNPIVLQQQDKIYTASYSSQLVGLVLSA